MQHRFLTALTVVIGTFLAYSPASADSPATPSLDPDRYHVVFNYQVVIDRPAADVWPQLIRLNKWIGFDLLHVDGPRMQEGEVFRLYKGQDFFFQTIKMIPEQLYVGVNLPSSFRGEESTGIAIFSLSEIDDRTIVSVTMSREYLWSGEGPNPNREIRESSEFIENTRVAWEERFFPRLRELVENQSPPDLAVGNEP